MSRHKKSVVFIDIFRSRAELLFLKSKRTENKRKKTPMELKKAKEVPYNAKTAQMQSVNYLTVC